MNKISYNQALSQLENCKNNFLLGLLALNIFSAKDELNVFNDSRCEFGSYIVEFAKVIQLLNSEYELACKEFLKLGLRALIKESFEVLSQYSKQEGIFNTFKAQPWYHLARLVRNAIAHSGHFKIKQNENYEWRNVRLCFENNREPLRIDFLGYDGVYMLFEEMYEFLYKLRTR